MWVRLRFYGPYGRQGCVLAWTVESNQGGRFDGNESVADSFRSGAVNFKTHVHAISRGFFPSYVCQKNLPSGKRTRCPGSTPRPLLSSQISTTLVNFNVVSSMLINKYNRLPLYDRTINLVYSNLSIEY
ncbi:hypothetical protein TNCV_1290901 [Trichonephila clavipes]|nr:hypothetical protein TNCV_1290901 [Trichonephila clavipes]